MLSAVREFREIVGDKVRSLKRTKQSWTTHGDFAVVAFAFTFEGVLFP